MKKELDQQEQCQVCHGNHYWVDADDHVIQCPECTIDEPKEVING
jgi:hypothetical protein